MKQLIKNKYVWGVAIVTVIAVVAIASHQGSVFNITNNTTTAKGTSPISGIACDNADRRPVAVMIGSDPQARPLSGIGQADAVVEMPVTPDGITRFMAVYQCNDPAEIGAVRSARQDFITLAAGFQAIYAHWGGEKGALATLDSHVIDNINALQFDGTVFYRKTTIAAPWNGFTTLALLFGQAQKFGYDLTKNFSGYPHSTDAPQKTLSNIATSISMYSGDNAVNWTYDQKTNTYSRVRDGSPEIDKNTNQQVTASVVAVMHTTSHILTQGDQYIVVPTTGQNTADIYENGIVIHGMWKKDPSALDSPLLFVDSSGNEIKFVPGSLWIEIVTDAS